MLFSRLPLELRLLIYESCLCEIGPVEVRRSKYPNDRLKFVASQALHTSLLRTCKKLQALPHYQYIICTYVLHSLAYFKDIAKPSALCTPGTILHSIPPALWSLFKSGCCRNVLIRCEISPSPSQLRVAWDTDSCHFVTA